MNHKSHIHTFFTALLLLGTLLVLGSFSSEAPKPAIAASTPGQQTAPTILVHLSNGLGIFGTGLLRDIFVAYSGETRQSGALTTGVTVLNPGDAIQLKLIANASYVYLGNFMDTPPASWNDALSQKCNSGSVHITNLFNSASGEACLYMTILTNSPPTLTPSGFHCGSIVQVDTSEGIREYTTTCTVTTNSPNAVINASFPSIYAGAYTFKPEFYQTTCTGYTDAVLAPTGYGYWDNTFYSRCLKFPLPPATLSWTFDVASVPPPPPPTLTFTGNPTTITQGDSATLIWSSQNTTQCHPGESFAPIPEWSDPTLPTSGSRVVHPASTTFYPLVCIGPGGSVSSDVTITVNPLYGDGFSCNSQNQCVFGGGGGASCLTNAGCPGGGGGGGCTSNCGGGGGGGGGCTDPATCPSLSNPDASQLSSDTSFFCPSNQVELKWNYSDPNNDPQNAFRLQVDNNSDFSSMLIDAYKDTSDHLYIIPPNVLAFGTTYYFVVSVKDSTGAWSNWSSAASFYTPSSCAPVSDFGLNKSKDISVNVTGSGNSTSNASQITVTPFSGFAAAVNLLAISISPNLPGISYSLNPPTLNQTQYSSGSAFQATIPGSTIPGNYTITIQGVGGGFTRTVNVILKVNSISSVIREI